MKEKTRKLAKKIKILVKVGKIAATAATVAMAIYTLIPKYEKIEGVDEKAFINAE